MNQPHILTSVGWHQSIIPTEVKDVAAFALIRVTRSLTL